MPDGTRSTGTQPGTWLLQADAAARAGCSLSAIRKWRRSGAVAERMTTNAAGQERVEVRLEDVMARVGQQVGELRHATPAGRDRPPVPGTVVVALSDLEALFERIAESDRQVDEAETKLQVAEDEARFLLGRLSELRQQLEAERDRAGPASSSPLSRPVPSPPPPRSVRSRQSSPPGRDVSLRLPPARPNPPAPPGAPGQARQGRAAVDLTSLAAELHQLYIELHTSRPAAGASPASIQQRRRTLAAYDAALLSACEELGVPGTPPIGTPLTAESRTALSKALAGAGLDVREAPPAAARSVEAGQWARRAGLARR